VISLQSIFETSEDKQVGRSLWYLFPLNTRTPSTFGTPVNVDSDDTPTTEVGGIIRPMGRKAAKRKVKAVVEDPMVEVMTKELSILGSTTLKDSEMFARYVVAQETKAQTSKQAIQLRDRHQSFKERQQCLKKLKYEDWILSMDICATCSEHKGSIWCYARRN